MAFLALAPQSASATQGPTLVRGNAPGEWRYWGADAWSTRYSPLDQINAANFDSLQVAWQWNAATFGDDEYYRTTPLYANGRLFTVATHASQGVRDRSRRRARRSGSGGSTKASAGRRRRASSPAAASPTGPTARNERVIVVTPGYHLASLDAKTGKPDPKFGKDGVVDLMEGLGYPLVPLAVDDYGPLDDQRGGAGAQGEARRDVGRRRRRPAPTARSASIPALGQIADQLAGDRRRRRDRRRQLVDPRLLPDCAAQHARATSAASTSTPASSSGSSTSIPQPGEFGAETWKNGSKIGTPGVGKNDAWAPYSADPELGLVYIPVGMPLIDEYGGHRPGQQPLRQQPRRDRREDRPAQVALPDGASRHLGLRHADGAEPARRHGQRPARARSSRRRRSRAGSTRSIA